MLIEHIAEISPRVEPVPRRTAADAQQHGGGLQPGITADMQPIAPTYSERTDGAFGFTVVNGGPRVVEVTNERSPLIVRILDGLTEKALWRRPTTLYFEQVGELGENRSSPYSSYPYYIGVDRLMHE